MHVHFPKSILIVVSDTMVLQLQVHWKTSAIFITTVEFTRAIVIT